MKLISPLQLNYPLSQKIHKWFQHSPSLLGEMGEARFISWLQDAVDHGWSWGILQGEELVGMCVIEPHDLGDGQVRDGVASIALARKAWGKGVFQKVGWEILEQIFEGNPALQRVSAWTLEANAPARAVSESLGFTLEGTVRDGAWVGGHTQNLVLYGLTRREFYGWSIQRS